MRKSYFLKLVLLFILFGVFLFYTLPGSPDLKVGKFTREMRLHKGLDLVGGSQLTYTVDTTNYDGETKDAVDQVIETMRLRVDALGVSEPNLQTTTLNGQDAIIIELPGIASTDQARQIIGETAQLAFYTINGDEVLSGQDVERASVVFDQTTNEPQVQLELSSEGGDKFATATAENIGQPIIIALDSTPISAPTVQQAITNGRAVITGVGQGLPIRDAVEEVRTLTNQINSGALPVPVHLEEERTVGASLGAATVRHSIFGGLLGFVAILIFMMVNYGLSGFVSAITLVMYGVLMLFAIQFIPITVSLAGIAGIVLSLGVTIDANILILERAREEVRAGKEPALAIRNGFKRAWESIRDANVSSAITAAILFWFGTGPIRGFALILIMGVVLGVISAVNINRVIINYLSTTRLKDKLVKS